jgi:Kef-type K+ transport system membrane component KefB
MDPYHIIILVCGLIVLSYFFNLIADKLKVPSVLLLITTGILANMACKNFDIPFVIPFKLISILGAIGLILIVLEGSLDLKLTANRAKLIRSSLFTAILLLVISTVSIAFIIQYFTGCEFMNGVMYAIPLSVISSAIVIPSVHRLPEEKKEFMVYEATFSDIIGIIVFNLFAFFEITTWSGVGNFSLSLLITILISLIFSLLLLFALDRIKTRVKIFFLFSMMILAYAFGKIFHLSSLLLILIFGLMLNNAHLFLNTPFKNFFNQQSIKDGLKQVEVMTLEMAFFIRTLFFVAFGFSIQIESVLLPEVFIPGTLILIAMYILRYINLRVFLKTEIFPEILIAPRGLITILLYYSIPEEYKIFNFNEGILVFVILATSIFMMFGLFFAKGKAVDLKSQVTP